jgi:hypothetical protein
MGKMDSYGITGNRSEYDGSLADGTYDATMQGLANRTNNDSWFGKQDWGMKGLGGTALGLGQLGLGAMSYFEGKKTQKKQRKLMDQQIDSNQYALEHKKKSDASWDNKF